MPELPVKEVRLPELHLPEIDRDQIISSLSGLRLPAVDITTIERPRFGRQARTGRFGLPAIDWRSIDLGPAVAGVAALGRLGSRARPLVRTALGGRRRRGRRGRRGHRGADRDAGRPGACRTDGP